jgi:hypothetical protein
MDRPDTPSAIIEGPFQGAYGPPTQDGTPAAPPRWIVSASFATEQEAQGFAVWCQTEHSAMATTGPPTIRWTEVDHTEPPSDFLPPEGILIAIASVDTHNDRSTGQGRVEIIYHLVARRQELPWDQRPGEGDPIADS